MRLPDHSASYERLSEILERDEFNQNWVNIWEWIIKPFEWFSGWFESIPFWAQIVVLVVLIGILGAIVGHVIWTMVKVWKGGGNLEVLAEPDAVRSIRELPAARVLLADARAAMERGDGAEALRLYYLALVATLREKGRVPVSTALTGREILARTSPPLEGLAQATRLFETTVYGGYEPKQGDIEMVGRLTTEV
jgi:hypothetical protein